jgi:hypothetical protein
MADEVSRQLREAIVAAFRPAGFDHDVPAFHEAAFTKPALECR